MKTLRKLVIIALLAITTGKTYGQAMPENTVLFEAYGGMSLLGATFKNLTNDASQNVSYNGVMPIGMRAEYMLSDQFGIGIDGFYTSNKVSYNEFSETDNMIYSYSTEREKIATYLTMNWHLAQNSEKFDFVLVTGVGYKNTTWKSESNDPSFTEASVGNIVPISFRVGTTARYFFNEFVGANLSFSIGGPLISGGLSFKI